MFSKYDLVKFLKQSAKMFDEIGLKFNFEFGAVPIARSAVLRSQMLPNAPRLESKGPKGFKRCNGV